LIDSKIVLVAMEADGKNAAAIVTNCAVARNDNGEPQMKFPNENVQRGVQDVEAVTLTWSKVTLIAIFLK
jgi:hypothetical protein